MKPEDLSKVMTIFTNDDIIDTSNLQQTLETTLERFDNLCFILENEENKIIGGIFGKVENDIGIINFLALSVEEHGKGYGAKLIQKVINKLRIKNVKMITLQCNLKLC